MISKKNKLVLQVDFRFEDLPLIINLFITRISVGMLRAELQHTLSSELVPAC